MTEIISAEEKHAAGIHKVECECFSRPWSENAVLSELSNGYSSLFVAVIGDEVAGWAGLEAVLDEASVTNIAVLPRARGQGIGRRLTEALIEECRKKGLLSLTLEVRASNEAAIKLYESLGFKHLGVRPRFYDFPKEDALMMKIDFT